MDPDIEVADSHLRALKERIPNYEYLPRKMFILVKHFFEEHMEEAYERICQRDRESLDYME